MSLYQTMFTRRSVRQYEKATLSQTELTKIMTFLENIKQLDGSKCHFKLANHNEVKNNQAPHYILAYSDDSTVSYVNVGYVLEQLDLYLQDNGYGSLWLGLAKPEDKSDISVNKENYEYCIMLAFGKTAVPLRKSDKDFNRYGIDAIASADNKITQAMRLAPSATNSQPWFIDFQENKITITYQGRGLLKAILKKRLSKIDVGIITAFAEIALVNEGKSVTSIEVVDKDGGFISAVNYQD